MASRRSTARVVGGKGLGFRGGEVPRYVARYVLRRRARYNRENVPTMSVDRVPITSIYIPLIYRLLLNMPSILKPRWVLYTGNIYRVLTHPIKIGFVRESPALEKRGS